MRTTLSSIARILLAPWQQRRNQRGLAVLWLILALAALPPGWFLYASVGHPRMLRNAEFMGFVELCMFLIGAWAMVASNVLTQNLPTAARLVPSHVRDLRVALLTGWAVLVVLFGASLGSILQAPFAATAGAAVVIALVTAAMRWRIAWMVFGFGTFPIQILAREPWIRPLADALIGSWQSFPGLIAGTAVAISALIVVSPIRTGGARHARTYAAREAFNSCIRLQIAGGERLTPVDGWRGWFARLQAAPYFWWMRRTLARRDRSTMARVMLALGPPSNWASQLASAGRWLVVVAVVIIGSLLIWDMTILSGMMSGFALGAILPFVLPALQARARLYQTRREQALMVLVPGVPRGRALNRALSLRLTGTFLVMWLGAIVVMEAAGVAAEYLPFAKGLEIFRDLASLAIIGALPLVPVLWRRWATVGSPTQVSGLLLVFVLLALAGAAWGLQHMGWLSREGIAAVYVAAPLIWCALRWRAMAGEPSAFPVGRLAK